MKAADTNPFIRRSATLEDFRHLIAKANEVGIEIAMDIAFQASPDHPYVKEHPEWFLKRPDGTIQYAENPPKKYQDIYPFHFESDAWRALWDELKSIFDFWIQQGVRIFRVDNPHTKPFALWQWIITEVKRTHPDVLFLAEAFTRPISDVSPRQGRLHPVVYLFFLAQYEVRDRSVLHRARQAAAERVLPPESLAQHPRHPPEFLQFGGRPAFAMRLVLAATLGASYGVYGPAFELQEHEALKAGGEEYLNSEKYELRQWDLERPGSLHDFIARVNRIRRENAPLQSNRGLKFHEIDNESLIAYSKASEDGADSVLVIVNLDPHHAHSGWLSLDLTDLGVGSEKPFQVHDLLSGARYLWQGARNYVSLDPAHSPAHIFRIRRRVRTERDFDYFL